MGSAGEWCLIESDPGVFTELIKDFGVKGLQVEELFSLDSESFEHLKPIYGLIFLFKCVSDDSVEGTIVQDNRLDKIFFAKQVINNACATQAIISILLNMNERCLELGETLQEFKAFTSSFDSAMKGLSLSNSKIIRQVHNSFSRQQVFEYDDKFQKSDESYHFIGYLPIDGRLYELDGLKPGPIDHGPIEKNDWLETVRETLKLKPGILRQICTKLNFVPFDGFWYDSNRAMRCSVLRPVIQKRMNRYAAGEIHFNLMAIVADVQMSLQKKIDELSYWLDNLENEEGYEIDEQKVRTVQSEVELCRHKLNEESQKRQRYRVENIRRKHNYLPFIIEMLRIVAANGQLVSLVELAKKKSAEKLKGN